MALSQTSRLRGGQPALSTDVQCEQDAARLRWPDDASRPAAAAAHGVDDSSPDLRCHSPPVGSALLAAFGREPWSPEVTPLCPQPRRPLTLFQGLPCSPGPPSPRIPPSPGLLLSSGAPSPGPPGLERSGTADPAEARLGPPPGLSQGPVPDLCELLGLSTRKAEQSVEQHRLRSSQSVGAFSSQSTSAGPTPSPEELAMFRMSLQASPFSTSPFSAIWSEAAWADAPGDFSALGAHAAALPPMPPWSTSTFSPSPSRGGCCGGGCCGSGGCCGGSSNGCGGCGCGGCEGLAGATSLGHRFDVAEATARCCGGLWPHDAPRGLPSFGCDAGPLATAWATGAGHHPVALGHVDSFLARSSLQGREPTPQLQRVSPTPPPPAPPQRPPSRQLQSPSLGGGRSGGGGARGSSDRTAQAFPKEVVTAMSRTQAGSKLLQQRLLKGHPTVIGEILEGIEVDLPELMCHMYGNYLCSASFQACSVGQRMSMLKVALQHLPTVATDKWGTHAMQSLISLVCTEEEGNLLIPALREHIVELSCDPNGAHVVQRALMSFGDLCPDSVLEQVAMSLRIVAHSPHGLCVLKKCITQSRLGPSQQRLLSELARHAVDLAQGPYGNYAVQHALDEWGGERCRPILEAMRTHLVQLAGHRFSLNVVERALRVAPADLQERLADELFSPGQGLCRDVVRRLVQAAPAAAGRPGGSEQAAGGAVTGAATGACVGPRAPPGLDGGPETRRRGQRSRRAGGGGGGGGAGMELPAAVGSVAGGEGIAGANGRHGVGPRQQARAPR
mmetsp:Transcript_94962/g.307181  ORF Transcript_94962/g.307181 Transcript_94962/m.307181 type:complete len:786 (-) Transcript_94962:284-2641(-)